MGEFDSPTIYRETTEKLIMRSGRQKQEKINDKSDNQTDLSKLKKKDLMEIMLLQSEEIDRLREENAALQAKLDDRNFQFEKIGSIAEASLAVTNIFEEAEKAAKLYLRNIRSKVNEK